MTVDGSFTVSIYTVAIGLLIYITIFIGALVSRCRFNVLRILCFFLPIKRSRNTRPRVGINVESPRFFVDGNAAPGTPLLLSRVITSE